MLKKINIFAVDDHELFLTGLITELENNENISVVGKANNSTSALGFIEKNKEYIDIAILDINLKEETKLFYLIEKVAIKYPTIKIIVLSTYEGKKLIRQLKEIGVMAFISKNDNINNIIKTVINVSKGKQIFPKCKDENRNSNLDSFELKTQITKRELEILQLISEGNNDTIISDKLNISSKTVKTHRTHLREKLNVKSSAELIAIAIRTKLI